MTVTKPKLLYSLSTRPPIPFPVRPTYSISLPTRDLSSAYLESLWSSTQSDQISLESFARLLLSLRAQKPPTELATLLRSLIRPLHDFDKRWRNIIPDLLEAEEEDEGASSTKRDDLMEKEQELIVKAYEKWEISESKRLEEEKAKKKAKGKEKARDQDRMMEDEHEHDQEDDDEEVRAENWVSEREVYETRLQALLLLTLLSLPLPSIPSSPSLQKKKGKGRKKKDPERDSTTLDPALLLDFLTDRLQIWRVMQGLSVDEDSDDQDRNKTEVVETRDTVQEWWADIVEPLYRNVGVSSEILLHHRVKLFPDAPNDSNSNSQNAFYEERSLMSLDRSARRRDLIESQAIIAESPTMKRLMSFSSLGGGGEKAKGQETFKIPPPPRRIGSTTSNPQPDDLSDSTKTSQDSGDSTTRPRLPRKQERPRPLPRGDSATANMKDMLKRREVSLARKPSVTGVKKKKGKNEGESSQEIGRKRKRKSASPQKLSASSRSTETLTLVPDTPAKPQSKSASFKKPFSRAISLPSFAALGAAVRPGASDPSSIPLPFGIPPPPVLPGDRRDEMDWEFASIRGGVPGSEDEDSWLVSRKEDFRAKGGRSRNTSGSTEGDDDSMSLMDTPKKKHVVLVADTPN
ncbi:hypothetical protein JCM3765_005581 [Sporobolomyces pararoseus]